MFSTECRTPLLQPVELLLRSLARRLWSGASESAPQSEPRPGLLACAERRPSGLLPRALRPACDLPSYLAHQAHLEAASVIAFARLAEALRALSAPDALVQGCLSAQRDQLRHALHMGELACEYGLPPPAPHLHAGPLDLLALACENAVEGCVRGTYGALVAAHQAARAKHLPLRLAMRAIAADEARHAALAYAVHAFLWTHLSSAQQAHVQAQQASAIAALHQECAPHGDPALRQALGLPAPSTARAMLGALDGELWSRRAPGLEAIA